MGLFDKLFDKKICDICGGEIGLLGNKKLEDGNMCKECAKKLSDWFDDRRHSTIDQINQQLAYRKANRAALDSFHPTLAYGERYVLRADLVNGVPNQFVVERTNDFKEENADLINFKDVTSFNIDVNEHRRELKFRNSKNEEVSYVPPRYEYSYDFYAEIKVNNPYFDDMRYEIFRNTLNLETIQHQAGPRFNISRTGFDPTLYPEYRQYKAQCDDMEILFRAGMQGTPLPGYEQQAPAAAPAPSVQPVAPAPSVQPAAAGPKFCQNCGAPATSGKFCQSCGSPL